MPAVSAVSTAYDGTVILDVFVAVLPRVELISDVSMIAPSRRRHHQENSLIVPVASQGPIREIPDSQSSFTGAR
jgi:hypothetical protein